MELRFTRHALERLFQRGITPEECEKVFMEGDVIEKYPDDKPFPSKLISGTVKGRILHLVVSSEEEKCFHVITAYEPDRKVWNGNFTKRK